MSTLTDAVRTALAENAGLVFCLDDVMEVLTPMLVVAEAMRDHCDSRAVNPSLDHDGDVAFHHVKRFDAAVADLVLRREP